MSSALASPTIRRRLLTPEVAEEWLRLGVPERAEVLARFAGLEQGPEFGFGEWDARSDTRMLWCREVSFAIPCREALTAITHWLERGVLEVGAGTGYWAAVLAARGGGVIATGVPGYGQPMGRWFSVERMRATKAIRLWPERDLLMVWPSYREQWSGDALHALAPGRKLALVAEGPGGCVGGEKMWNALTREFELLETIELPRWLGIHDELTIWQKKSGGTL